MTSTRQDNYINEGRRMMIGEDSIGVDEIRRRKQKKQVRDDRKVIKTSN